jgi:hypothetical protein
LALSLSKGTSIKVFQQGFDRLSPNGQEACESRDGREVPAQADEEVPG